MDFVQFRTIDGRWVIVQRKFLISVEERNSAGDEVIITTTKGIFIARMDFDEACTEVMSKGEE